MSAPLYIQVPFANAGDKTAIPVGVQPDGSVSQTEGFGVDYELDPATNPSALEVPREQTNQVLYNTQVAVQGLQLNAFPPHVTASDNGGTAIAYPKNASVRATDGNNYYSLIDGNEDVPPSANWGLIVYAQPFQPGDVLEWDAPTIRAGGWLWQNGTTIGNAASNATQRANADTVALFTFYWNQFPNSTLQLFSSAGAAINRGVSAAADYAANTAISLPDKCGRASFGADNMGGITAKGRITTAGSGIDGTVVAASGGAETVQLTSNQNGQHAHSGSTDTQGNHTHFVSNTVDGALSDPLTSTNTMQHSGTGTQGNTSNTFLTGSNPAATIGLTSVAGAHSHAVTTGNSGNGAAHQNMPPAIIVGGKIVKL